MAQPVAVAFQAALPQEVQPFLRRMHARRLQVQELPAWEFTWRTGRGVVVVSGLGEDAAARTAAWVLEHYQPQVFVGLGFGGAVTPELPAGAVVLGESYWRYEPETKALEELATPPFPAWSTALEGKLRAAGLPVFRGSLVSTRKIIPKAPHADLLANLTHPVLDLETGAATAAAGERNLPFLALRVITDMAGEEIPDFLVQAVQEGKTPTAAEVLTWVAADPSRVPVLCRLWRRSRLATQHLGRVLAMVLEVR